MASSPKSDFPNDGAVKPAAGIRAFSDATSGPIQQDRLEAFAERRPLLFAMAYRMLGSADDAEAWLDEALPKLTLCEQAFPPKAEMPVLLHLDVRSDNILFRQPTGDAVFLDWNW